MQWFRFYTEAISDKKLKRIARDINEPLAHVVGVWTIVLSMASDSPERGKLLISADVPATIDDISDAAGCNVTETFLKLIVTGLVTTDVTDDGHTVYVVAAWDKRQYESDSSATRVRRHREKKKQAESNVDVTLRNGYSNAPDTDTDTDTILATQGASAPSVFESTEPPSLVEQFDAMLGEMNKTKNKVPHLMDIYKLCFGATNMPKGGEFAGAAKQVGSEALLAKYMFDNVSHPPVGPVLPYIIATHKAKQERRKQTGGNRAVETVTFNNGSDIYA